MIDWDQPLVRADTGARVWVFGTRIGDRGGDWGGIVDVQDAEGNIAPFYRCGTPIGHWHRIKNEDAGVVVRTRLATLLMKRAKSLLEVEQLATELDLEALESWGSF